MTTHDSKPDLHFPSAHEVMEADCSPPLLTRGHMFLTKNVGEDSIGQVRPLRGGTNPSHPPSQPTLQSWPLLAPPSRESESPQSLSSLCAR